MVFWTMANPMRRPPEENSVLRIYTGYPRLSQQFSVYRSSNRNLIIFDDLMTEAKCDQRVDSLLAKGSLHRNISIVYLAYFLKEKKSLQGYRFLIDIQQMATLARRIRPPGLEIIKLEYSLRLKIKRNDWLLADMCPQAANHCALF